jgi:hypothetical protein
LLLAELFQVFSTDFHGCLLADPWLTAMKQDPCQGSSRRES